jgi:ribonuclease inhibitor
MERPQHIDVHLHGVQSSQELHRLLQAKLAFPSWYGRNWDAFWDSITGLVAMPLTLRLLGWAELEARLPRDAHHLRQCLKEMAEKYPDEAAHVVYA